MIKNLRKITMGMGSVLLLAMALSTVACGGSVDKILTPTPTPLPSSAPLVQTQVNLFWIARSRSSLTSIAPASAQSAQIVLEESNGKRTSVLVNRRTNPESYSETVALPSPVTPGTGILSVTFFAQTGGSGDIVASANEPITIPGSGGLLPSVTTISKIASVHIFANQVLTALVPGTLQYSLHDSEDRIVAVTPGSLRWEIAGSEVLTQDANGAFLGSQVGTADVRLRVDDVSSLPTQVRVTSDTQISVSPNSLQLSPGQSSTVTALVTNTKGGSTNSTWRVMEPDGGQLTAAGLYTAPAQRGTYHLEATSVFDSSKKAQITVKVLAGNISGVIQ